MMELERCRSALFYYALADALIDGRDGREELQTDLYIETFI